MWVHPTHLLLWTAGRLQDVPQHIGSGCKLERRQYGMQLGGQSLLQSLFHASELQ